MLYRRADLELSRSETGMARLWSPSSDRSLVVPRVIAPWICQAVRFETLDDMAARAADELGFDDHQTGSIRRILGELATAGLLVPKSKVLDAWRESPRRPAATIESLCVPTADRPQALDRCLSSFLTHTRRFGRSIRICVSDDSRSRDAMEANLEVLRALSHHVEVSYAGPNEKYQFAANLARETGSDPALIQYALLPSTVYGRSTGANRNTLLLQTLREVSMQVDDDIVCDFAKSPSSASGAAVVANRFTDFSHWFFESQAALEQARRPDETDVLSTLEGWLGRSLGDCLAPFADDQITLDPGDERVFSYPDVPRWVAATNLGLAGHSGFEGPDLFRRVIGASRRRLLAGRDRYHEVLASSQVLSTVDRPLLGDGASFMSTVAGYDQRDLLPPFFPVLRGQDGIFGWTLGRCLPGAHVAFLPGTLVHKPVETRRFTTLIPENPAVTVSSLVFAHLARWSEPYTTRSADRMQSLGRHFQELEYLDRVDFRRHVRGEMMHLWWRRLDDAETLLSRFGHTPDYWADDLEATVRAYERALAGPNVVLSDELLNGRTTEEAWARLQELLGKFGRLLEAWPDWVQATALLRAKGVEIARRVRGDGSPL